MKSKCDCPICGGTGKFELPKSMSVYKSEKVKEIAIRLHGKGYSIRQIMTVLGYKSPRSIQEIIKDDSTNKTKQTR